MTSLTALLALPGLFAARINADGGIEEASEAWTQVFSQHFIQDVVSRPRWGTWPDGVTGLTATGNNGDSHALVGLRVGSWVVALRDEREAQTSGRLAALAQEMDDLHREAVRQRAAATRAREDLQALTFGLGHDLQRPLRRAQELLQENAEAMHHLDAAQALILRLVAYGRAGAVDLDVQRFPLQDIVQEIAAIIPEAHLTCGILPEVDGDPGLISQVLENLVQNAVKYGKPPVSILWKDGRLLVEDHGPGITASQAASMFDLFQRHATGPGHGIGLALCRKIMEKHGGSIHAEPLEPGCRIVLSWPSQGLPP